MSCKLTLSLLLVIPFTLCQYSPSQAATPSFQGLGDLPGGSFASWASGMSADGSVVVGNSTYTCGTSAFRWTSDSGMQGLGILDVCPEPFDSSATFAYATSADGSVVVGCTEVEWGLVIPPYSGKWALRWTSDSGPEWLGDLPGGNFDTEARATSSDGSVVVGYGLPTFEDGIPFPTIIVPKVFRWTEETGMVNLGSGTASAVSADGSVVAGSKYSFPSKTEAFRWTEETGMVGLSDLPGGEFRSEACAISADGSVVVGWSNSSSFYDEAFRWTEETGMVGLGDLPGGEFRSEACAISADGSVVVGWSDSGRGFINSEAFIWDQENGMQNLQDLLVNTYGLDLTGWQLTSARGVSTDGLTFVGSGINPNGNQEAWITTIPEPTSLSLLVLGGIALARRKRLT